MGLGLSICRDIIQALGGEVKIISEEGKGTDFIIQLKSKCSVDENEITEAKLKNSFNVTSSYDSENALSKSF